MASAPSSPPRKAEWAPRIWEGSDFFAWIKLLGRNRFAVHPAYWYIAAIVTIVSLGNTLLRWLEAAAYGRIIRKTEIGQPPIFILGHWRTGTTLLHELLIRDERVGFPTTYECLAPCHFLLTERLLSRLLWFLIPSRRPMDNMPAGFDRPQEDEFALCLLGAGSPYEMIAFPNRAPGQEFLDLVDVSPRRLRRWRRTFKTLLRTITCKTGKRLILKSPPHTARIPVLKQMFPGAIFIHIVRDPCVVFPSTLNLWRTLWKTQGLQRPTSVALEEHVLRTGELMHKRLEEGKRLLAADQFYELRYEDLTRDPVAQMQQLYEHLGLGGFTEFRPRLEEYLATIKGYETNRYDLTPQQRDAITQRWGTIIEQYGYSASGRA